MSPPRLLAVTLGLAVSSAACDVGSVHPEVDHVDGDGDADAGSEDIEPPPADYALEVTPTTADLALGTETVLTVDLSSDNFEGPVVLAAIGAPESWSITFDPAEVVVPRDGVAQSSATIRIPSDGLAGEAALSIAGNAAPGERRAEASIRVANVLDLAIDDGTGGGQHPFPTNVVVKLGATVRFVNRDTTTSHSIHASGDAGFDHQDGSMDSAPGPDESGGSYEVTITEPGTYDYYCHDHGAGSGVGTVGVAAAD